MLNFTEKELLLAEKSARELTEAIQNDPELAKSLLKNKKSIKEYYKDDEERS